jgi:hypothetical protein
MTYGGVLVHCTVE